MLSIIGGFALAAAGGGAFWYCMPRNGKPSRVASVPMFDTVVPLGVVAALTIGLCMIVSGLF